MKREIEQKVLTAVIASTLAPIIIALGLIIVSALAGNNQDTMIIAGPLFFFGLAMIGIILFGVGVYDLVNGKFNWFLLLVGGPWMIFFGRGFLLALGVHF